MLKRKYRLGLKIRPRFERSFKTPYFILKVAKNNLLYNRYGFIVSKKIDKRAVVRNKIKRLIRGGVEDLTIDLKEGYDVVFIAVKNIENLSKEEVKKIQRDLFSKEGLLK
ncbi:MAG: ribonuclease P protein component [Nitrospirae bacterium GWA2_46_11]|nr:MAG: ribonuclease P protein component [Nitrospirae bacterium GWA2_46_11]